MADHYVIRCPVCLTAQAVPKTIALDRQLDCNGCKQSFFFKNALAATAPADAVQKIEVTPVPDTTLISFVAWAVFLILAVPFVDGTRTFVADMKGDIFLLFFLALFIALFIGSVILRGLLPKQLPISLMACLIFEVVGAFRIVDGLSVGMSKFGFLIAMMVIGGMLFFVRADSKGSSHSSGSCSTSSSSGSAGGCGGGGGCGGCGG